MAQTPAPQAVEEPETSNMKNEPTATMPVAEEPGASNMKNEPTDPRFGGFPTGERQNQVEQREISDWEAIFNPYHC